MGRQSLLVNVGTGVLIAALPAGCGHTDHASPPTSCVCAAPALAQANVVIQNSAIATAPGYFPRAIPTPEVNTVPSDRLPDSPTQTTSAKPVEEPHSGVLHLDESVSISLKHEEKVPRRSFADITAKPGFAHAPDYSWIAGELQFLHSRKIWRVRYASVDEEDRYGGGMTLIDAGPMTEYQDGQMVHVEGGVADIDSRESAYRVRHIQPLGNSQSPTSLP